MILLLFLQALLGSQTYAQRPYFKSHQLPATVDQMQVDLIYQDSDGFIWLGSDQGLVKFDGTNFQQIARDDSLAGIAVSAISDGPNGRIWVGYENGYVGTVSHDHVHLLEFEEGYPKAAITGFAATNAGTVCIATAGEGLYYFSKRLYNINTEEGLTDNYIYCIEKDRNGRIWLGTDHGINVLNPDEGKHVKTITSKDGLPDNIVMQLKNSDDGNMWVGMQDAGLCKLDLERDLITTPELIRDWKFGAITGIVAFEDEVWLGTQNKGIVAYVNKYDTYLRTYNKEHGLQHNSVRTLVKDRENNVWVASGDHSIQSVNKKFEFISRHEGLDFANLHMVSHDMSGNLWFGNATGLYSHKIVFTGFNVLRHWSGIQTADEQRMISLYEDANGSIWIGTFGAGLICLDPTTGNFRRYTEQDGLVNNNVFSIAGNLNEIWFGTLGGVSRVQIDPAISHRERHLRFENFDKTQGLGNNFIYTVFIDSKGRVWFGTDGQGLTVWVDGIFKNLDETLGLSNTVVLSITEDHDGNIWFSTPKDGIYKFNMRTVRNFSVQQGLSSNAVSGLITDAEGNILIVHKSGIDILNPEDETFRYYGAEMGIPPIEQELNAATKDINGDVWIATQTSLIKYTPDKERVWNNPVTRINRTSVFFDDGAWPSAKVLRHDQNHVTFDYVGLWYQNPEEVQYSYKLEGYDLDWNLTKDRSVTYPRLNPGTYKFSVRSSVDGNFDKAVVEHVSFEIKKPFWATFWFIALTIMLVLSAVFLIVKARVNRLREFEKLQREKAVQQFETLKSQVNPHFLFNSFNTLATVIEENQELAVEYVEKLSDYYRNILEYRQKDTIQLREEIELINDYFFLQKKRYDENLQLSIRIPNEKLGYKISPLTLQILVENAIKHNVISKDKPLHIEISMEDDNYLAVKNNKQLKRHRVKSTKIGLQNISNRYKLLTDKDVRIDATEDHFIVEVPLLSTNALKLNT